MFTHTIKTYNGLMCNYVFKSFSEVIRWIKEDFPELQKKYPDLSFNVEKLPKLKVGDTCYVRGDGDETYEILRVEQYEKDRYGFVLSHGFIEEVSKCYSSPYWTV